MAQRELETLSREECLALLATRQVGRLVYTDPDGPAAVPVNYALAGEDVVFRVAGGAKQAAMELPIIAFEVDAVDDDVHTGWSVLIRGRGAEVPIERVPALLREMHHRYPTPWAQGIHNVWLTVVPTAITGRRLGAAAPTVVV
jgi:nitroimidazol reductase NimA-like FMN-containing flavoprotein (pyridoxamine 5'-phosphate oxidase superfamily)